jgi:hypothetical protein
VLGIIFASSVAAAAPSVAPSRELATRGPVTALSADGNRVALVVLIRYDRFDCAAVIVWEPAQHRTIRLQRPCGPGRDLSLREATRGVALAGARAAWLHEGGGNALEELIETATLEHPKATLVGYGASTEGVYGDFARQPIGDGSLLAFTVERRCDADGEANGRPEDQCPPGGKTGDVVGATVWGIGGHGGCPTSGSATAPFGRGLCTRIAEEDGELSVLAVDSGRIVVRTDTSVKLLTASGAVLEEFDVRASSAALSGKRLALRTRSVVALYNAGSGELTSRIPVTSRVRLQDLDRDILVTALDRTITLRRLSDGRTRTLQAGRGARAQLEPSGLFVSGARHVTFTPMREVLRRLSE